jgi:hypothetical protein
MNIWMEVSAESELVVQDNNLPSVVSVLIVDLMKLLFVSPVQVFPDISVKDKFAQMSHTDLLDQLVEMIHIVS